jgi:hypothetical protein
VIVPWSTSDYIVVFCGASANTETAYSVGINVMPDNKFSEFTDVAKYEPNDAESSATVINTQDRIMSYLHKNDFDYYRIKLGSTPPAVKPLVITDHALDAANGYLDIRVLNAGIKGSYSAYLGTNVTLSTTSGYVTITKASSTIDVYLGDYATLTTSSTASEANATLLQTYNLAKAFKISISNSCPSGTAIPFEVTFSKGSETWSDTFVLTKN